MTMLIEASTRNAFEGEVHQYLGRALLVSGDNVENASWQSVEVGAEMQTRELRHVVIDYALASTQPWLAEYVKPNLPWAEDHFQERISGEPLNPPPSHEWWPFNRNKNDEFRKDEQFSHTYPERFWPVTANIKPEDRALGFHHNRGIRYPYGDLKDVVELLRRDPHTRQAYLPVWFPEDTGVVHRERVPCTLGYHFMMRNGWLDCTYHIRSCDFLRHFRDDVYMAGRLCQWVASHLSYDDGNSYDAGVIPGRLVMHIGSLHVFQGDMPRMKMEFGQ